MSIIDWSDDQFLLGVESMDDTHKEFVALVNKLEQANDAEFKLLFEELYNHTLAHFQQEEALMGESRFPAIGEHKDEHQRVLGELVQFKQRVDKGLVGMGRAYIKERMPTWFPLHASTMDSALAAHLKSLNKAPLQKP